MICYLGLYERRRIKMNRIKEEDPSIVILMEILVFILFFPCDYKILESSCRDNVAFTKDSLISAIESLEIELDYYKKKCQYLQGRGNGIVHDYSPFFGEPKEFYYAPCSSKYQDDEGSPILPPTTPYLSHFHRQSNGTSNYEVEEDDDGES